MSNQDYSIDDFFTEENIVLPEVIVEYPIEDIKGYSDDPMIKHPRTTRRTQMLVKDSLKDFH